MRLIKARVQGYRSVVDSGEFEIENLKTILVGPNEAGKTAVLQALQKLNPPPEVEPFDLLRDYPRARYASDITGGTIVPANTTFVTGYFKLDSDEQDHVPDGFKDLTYVFGRRLDNTDWHRVEDAEAPLTYSIIKKDLLKLASLIEAAYSKEDRTAMPQEKTPREALENLTTNLSDNAIIDVSKAGELKKWLESCLQYIDSESPEDKLYDKLTDLLDKPDQIDAVLKFCHEHIPVFVLFNNYYSVKPSIHLGQLATRIKTNVLDDKQYDYGNICLLKLLGFKAEELSKAGNATPADTSAEGMKKYKDILDERDIQLNAASIRLTDEIVKIWNPNNKGVEASKIRIKADGQYLKVVVEDSLGVEVELDQRSAGFQWMVSFFVVFFAEAADKHKNAILLLDEPGLSLHGLKQAEFRKTLSMLSEKNQTLYTTHSPFLVGANELELVRVVEMKSREEGTKVHTTLTAGDAGALLPLQEALGYDLAQSLFIHQKNLVLEGLTDYWYVEAVSELAGDAGKLSLDSSIAMNPANSAGKVVYYATILHAQELKVAALLDSDAEGDLAAQQETLINALGNKRILRTKDVYEGPVVKPEIEDLFRKTLIDIAKNQLNLDVEAAATSQVGRPIVDVFKSVKADFSKYQLAKAFLRWTRDHNYSDLAPEEQLAGQKLIEKINKALK